MKATHLGLVVLALIGACAQQEDAPSTTCNARSVNCSAGATSSAGSAGAATAGAGGGSAAGAPTGGANTGGDPGAGAPGGGALGAGAPGGGAPGAGAPGGGAPGAGAPAGGAPAGGAPAGGAPAGGAPAGGAPAGGAPAGGAPGTNTVVIETNRSDGSGARAFLKVVPPENYLQWVGTSATDAEVFQEVVVGTDQVKLLATSVNKYVVLDQTVPATKTEQADYLAATAPTAATAAVLGIALCAATNAVAAKCAPNCRGLQVLMGDDDGNNFVASDDQFTLKFGARARSGSCGAISTAWESWEIIAH